MIGHFSAVYLPRASMDASYMYSVFCSCLSTCIWCDANSDLRLKSAMGPPTVPKRLDVFYKAVAPQYFQRSKLIISTHCLMFCEGEPVGSVRDVRPKSHADCQSRRIATQYPMRDVPNLLLWASFHFHVIMVMRFSLSRLRFITKYGIAYMT